MDKKVTCYCVVIVSICLFVCVFVFVRFSSIYGACYSKQTSNARGFCVHVVSQLVVRFKPREDVVRLACSSKVSHLGDLCSHNPLN